MPDLSISQGSSSHLSPSSSLQLYPHDGTNPQALSEAGEMKFPPSQGKVSLTALSRMKAKWDGKAELAELDMTPTTHTG